MMDAELEVMRVNVSDLEIDGIFDGDELIYHVDENSMDTVRYEPGYEKPNFYDMRVYHYNIKRQGGVAEVTINGYGEILAEDDEYDEFKARLKSKDLWENKNEN